MLQKKIDIIRKLTQRAALTMQGVHYHEYLATRKCCTAYLPMLPLGMSFVVELKMPLNN